MGFDPDAYLAKKSKTEKLGLLKQSINQRNPELEKLMYGSFSDTGRLADSPGESIDSYTGAPLRTAISEMQSGNFGPGMLKKAWDQVGKDPQKAPTGENIVETAGVENPYLKKGLGFAVDVAADATGAAGLIRRGAVPLMGAVKKAGKAFDAKSILSKIDSPEKAIALTGKEREKYLKALDEVYGDRSKRSQEMGFGKRNWYHGTTVPVDEFKHEAKGLSTNAQSAKKGFFFAEDPSTASDYADLAREKGIIREGDDVTTKWKSEKYDEPESLGYQDYGDKERHLYDLMSRKDQEKKRLQNLAGWEKAKKENAEWIIKGAEREGKTVDEFIKEKTKRIQSPIKSANKKEIEAAKRDYHQSLIEFVKTNDPSYARKILSIDLEVAKGEKREAILNALKIGEDYNFSTGQNVLPVRLKGTPQVKNYKGESYRDTTYADEMSKAQAAGKDSVLFKNTYDPADPSNYVKQDIAAVFEPNQIRSINAAFDPRFKDSDKLLAGKLGENPLSTPSIKTQNNNENEGQKMGFDPDKYLAKKRQPIPGEGLLRGSIEALPMAGGVAGGFMGSALGPVGIAGGAGLGAAGGKALENLLEAQLFGDQKTMQQIYMDPALEGAYGVAGEGIGRGLGRGLEAIGTGVGKAYQGAKGVLEATPGLSGITKALTGRFKEMPKPNSEAIQESASRIKIKPTEGMLTENQLRQGMESSLSQSPTAAGEIVRNQYRDVHKGLKEGAQTVLKEGESAPDLWHAGMGARQSIDDVIQTEVKPAVQIYEDLTNNAKAIDVESKQMQKVSGNILKLDAAKFKSNPMHGTVKTFAEDISNIKTLDQLRAIKSQVGRQMRASEGEDKFVLSQINDKLIRAEKSIITRASLKAAANMKQGNEIAKQMLKDLKTANKIYRGVNEKAKTMAKEFGLKGISNYQDFARAMQDLPDEKVAEKFWQAKNFRGMSYFKEKFPQAFEYVRKAKMGDIYNKSIVGEDVSATALVREANKMTPQAQRLLFGDDGIQVIKDLEKVKNAIPPKMGPSGTPQGQEYRDFNILSPSAWINETRRGIQLWALRNPGKASKMNLKSVMPTQSPLKGPAVKSGLINQGLLKPAFKGLLQPQEESYE